MEKPIRGPVRKPTEDSKKGLVHRRGGEEKSVNAGKNMHIKADNGTMSSAQKKTKTSSEDRDDVKTLQTKGSAKTNNVSKSPSTATPLKRVGLKSSSENKLAVKSSEPKENKSLVKTSNKAINLKKVTPRSPSVSENKNVTMKSKSTDNAKDKKVPPPVPPKPKLPNKDINYERCDSTDSLISNFELTLNKSVPSKPTEEKAEKDTESDILDRKPGLKLNINAATKKAGGSQFVSEASAVLSPVTQRRLVKAEQEAEGGECAAGEQESGVEQISISASSVIKKFENAFTEINKANSESSLLLKRHQTNKGPVTATEDDESMKDEEDNKQNKSEETKEEKKNSTTAKSKSLAVGRRYDTPRKSNFGSESKTPSNVKKPDRERKSTDQKNDNLSTRKRSDMTSEKIVRKPSITKKGSIGVKSKKHKDSVESLQKTSVIKAEDKCSVPKLSVEEPVRQPKKEQDERSVVKTTMTVRLQPGQTRKLSPLPSESCAVEKESDPVCDKVECDETEAKPEKKDSVGWRAELEAEEDPATSCGLEISFESVPQDIDIKLIADPPDLSKDERYKGIKEGSKGIRPQLLHRSSLVGGCIDSVSKSRN